MKHEQTIYGLRPVIEAIEAGKELDKVFIQKGLQGSSFGILRKLLSEHSIPWQFVPVEKLNRIIRGNHQGVVAILSNISYQPLEPLLMEAFEKGETPLFVILDRVTDVRNMGAIARTAACAGAHGLIVPDKGSAPFNADAMKSSAGALNVLPVHRSPNLKETIKYLKNSGVKVIAASEHAEKAYYEVQTDVPLAVIMGSEEDGVSGEYLKLCDEVVRIPMRGSIASLNVSVAAGIILFDVIRRMKG